MGALREDHYSARAWRIKCLAESGVESVEQALVTGTLAGSNSHVIAADYGHVRNADIKGASNDRSAFHVVPVDTLQYVRNRELGRKRQLIPKLEVNHNVRIDRKTLRN
jgi:hypothetical protein